MNVAAESLSRARIRKITEKLRELIGCSEKAYFPIVEFIEWIMGDPENDFDYEIVEAQEMQDMYGNMNTGLNVMKIREDVYIGAINGNCIKVVDSKKTTTNGYNYEYSVLSFGDKRYVKLFGNYTIKNAAGTSFPPFTFNTITNLGLFPVNITTKIKKVLDFSLNCFNPGSGFFLIGGIKKYIETTNAYADVQFLMTNPPQNIGLEWMMVCEIE